MRAAPERFMCTESLSERWWSCVTLNVVSSVFSNILMVNFTYECELYTCSFALTHTKKMSGGGCDSELSLSAARMFIVLRLTRQHLLIKHERLMTKPQKREVLCWLWDCRNTQTKLWTTGESKETWDHCRFFFHFCIVRRPRIKCVIVIFRKMLQFFWSLNESTLKKDT